MTVTAPSGCRGLLADAKAGLADAIDLRRQLHRHPEIGLQLPRTQQAILDALADLPLTVTTGRTVTSVVATLDGAAPGPTVLLRADMDALPMPEETGLEFESEVDGAMHACGHDSHVAMLVGAARVLAARRDELAGRIVFMFQPGEEGHQGARYMLEEGLLDGDPPPTFAFALHQTPNLPARFVVGRRGAVGASSDYFEIAVNGRGGHAHAPHRACDPIPAAAEIITAIQTMITRTVNVFEPAVVTVTTIQAGTTRNVIPDTAILGGTIRTQSEATRTDVRDHLRRVAEQVAGAHGAVAALTIDDGTPVLVNDPGAVDRILAVAERLLGPGTTSAAGPPMMGAEDFSYVLSRVPGAMVLLGTGPVDGAHLVPPCHSSRMTMDESAMAAGIALHAAVALDVCRT